MLPYQKRHLSYMCMYHKLGDPLKKRKLLSYFRYFLQAVVKISKLNEGSKGMSRLEISKLRKWMLILIVCIAVYLSTVSISHNLWHRRHQTLLNKKTSEDIYIKFVQSHVNDERNAIDKLDFDEADDVENEEQQSISVPNFEDIQTMLLFIGYPRSGSTLLGSILDAHPNIVIANEYNLLAHWKNFSHNQKTKKYVFNELWQNSLNEAKNMQRAQQKNFFFSYHVPGAWQGRYQKSIKVIGDKKCTSTTRNLARTNSTQHKEISSVIEKPIKFIHIIRNPFDNIATMTLRAGHPALRKKAEDKNLQFNSPAQLRRQMKIYFRLVMSNVKLRKRYGKNVFDVHYTSFIRQPKVWLKTICEFLEVYCSENYLDSCVKVIFKKETFTRRHIVWPPDVKEAILQKIDTVDFLNGLSYEIT